jgi:hypothetical protein
MPEWKPRRGGPLPDFNSPSFQLLRKPDRQKSARRAQTMLGQRATRDGARYDAGAWMQEALGSSLGVMRFWARHSLACASKSWGGPPPK